MLHPGALAFLCVLRGNLLPTKATFLSFLRFLKCCSITPAQVSNCRCACRTTTLATQRMFWTCNGQAFSLPRRLVIVLVFAAKTLACFGLWKYLPVGGSEKLHLLRFVLGFDLSQHSVSFLHSARRWRASTCRGTCEAALTSSLPAWRTF